jgi:hypothetical protein
VRGPPVPGDDLGVHGVLQPAHGRARAAAADRAGLLTRGPIPAAGGDRGADRGDGRHRRSHHAAEPFAPARRRHTRREIGRGARRGTPAELGGRRRVDRCHRVVSRATEFNVEPSRQDCVPRRWPAP